MPVGGARENSAVPFPCIAGSLESSNMWSLAGPRPMATGFLFLLTAILIVKHSASTDGAGNSSLARPGSGCRDKCGNVSIPYPFGIAGDPGCYLHAFHVYCIDEEPYLAKEKSLKVMGVNLSNGEVRIQKYVASSCHYETIYTGGLFQLRRDHFVISDTKNKFTAIGCATIATIHGANQYDYTSLCGSFCSRNSIDNSTECTGMGCCQIHIPPNLRTLKFSLLTIDNITNDSDVRSFSPCSYAFVAEADWFKFNPSYVTSTDFGTQYGTDGRGVPMVVDWAVDNKTCMEANKNMESSQVCLSANSECVDASNGLGYRCICSTGYDGNPYLKEGCQDIDECNSKYPSPCNGNECVNTIGSYICSCPNGTQSSDPNKERCTRIPPPPSKLGLLLVIGISVGCMVLVVSISVILVMFQNRKLAKEKDRFFKQNGGQMLYQQILSQQVDTVTIFTIEDLKKATNNFDKSKELGTGGHGTVYKGILKDDRVVAVKRSKMMNVVETEEFVQEIIILSQTNHRNIVRLIGCCLEVEVPILVYEFIPNGTLFQLIHESDGRPLLSLESRLKIAQESAEALAYLHLSTNSPIVHADVKSLNILLDENYMAKVTDFGASRMLPKDTVQFMTMVQGTLGYLDPEYLQERRLTEKSDVYSFGVVLLELITRKKAIYSEGTERGKCLASCFIQAMKENRVEGMLDPSITCAEMVELLREVAVVGNQCLNIKGEERPSMIEVADKLKSIRSTWRELLLRKHNETELLVEAASFGRLPPSMFWTARAMGMEV